MFKMSDSLIELRGGWHRARVQLGKAFRFLGARSAERGDALKKANDDLRAAQADLEKRWQKLAEAQRLSHSGRLA